MPHYFVALRIWLGFSPDFPFELFADIPDDDLPQALEAFALPEFECRLPEIESRRQERIEKLKRQSAQRLGSPNYSPRPGRRSQSWRLRRPTLEPSDDELGELPVYLRGFAYLGLWNPHDRLPVISPNYYVYGECANREFAKLAVETIPAALKNTDHDGAFDRVTPRTSITCINDSGEKLAAARIKTIRDRAGKGDREFSWYVMQWLPEIDTVIEDVAKAWPIDLAGECNTTFAPKSREEFSSTLPAPVGDGRFHNESPLSQGTAHVMEAPLGLGREVMQALFRRSAFDAGSAQTSGALAKCIGGGTTPESVRQAIDSVRYYVGSIRGPKGGYHLTIHGRSYCESLFVPTT